MKCQVIAPQSNSQETPALIERKRMCITLARFASGAVLLAGVSGLMGWLTDLEFLGRPSSWHAPMSFVTSILLCLAALALVLQSLPTSQGRRRAVRLLGMATLAIGAWTLLAYVAGGALPSDVWLLDRRMASGFRSHINRMSPASSACFTLFGAVACMGASPRRRGETASQLFSALGLLLALVSLVGYLYSITLLVELRDYKPIAPQTAGAFFLLFVGVYLGSPDGGIMRIVLSEESGGMLARRLLFFVFFIPIFLGAVASAGLRAGLFTAATSVFFLTAATDLCLAGLLLFNAFTINRAERGRRTAQKSLQESERAYRTLFQNAADPMFLVDRDLTVLEANAAAAGCLEISAAALRGQRMPDLTRACAVETERRLAQAFEDGHASFESCGRTPGGRDVPLEINARAVEFRGGTAVLTIARDLSERRRAERALAEKEGLLQQAQKMEAIGRLAGGVAHDFNNLLTVIMGYADLLLLRTGLPNDARSDAGEVKMCAARAAALTRQLLAFSRQQPSSPRSTDANRVVEEMTPLLRRLIGENVRLDIRLRAAHSTIRIDPTQLEQVVLNLAVNARDAMPEGGTLTIESLERSVDSDPLSFTPAPANGLYVELSVQDTGCGIPPEVQPHIFEPFFTTKPEAHGTGLGLSTVYGIVTQNSGSIGVDTSPRAGTAMRVLFPVARAAEEGAAPQGPTARVMGQRSGTLLLVEDDPSVRDYLSAGLQHVGYSVLVAGSGEEALRTVELYRGTIDAVVSDVVMPGIGGRQLAELLAQRLPGVRVLFMSGYDQEGLGGVGSLCGRFDLITKPFTVTELVEKLLDDSAATTVRI